MWLVLDADPSPRPPDQWSNLLKEPCLLGVWIQQHGGGALLRAWDVESGMVLPHCQETRRWFGDGEEQLGQRWSEISH